MLKQLLCLLLTTSILFGAVPTKDKTTADDYLKNTFESLSHYVINQTPTASQSTLNHYQEINTFISNIFDFVLIGKLTVGRQHWYQATPEQQTQFIATFKTYLFNTYLIELPKYAQTTLVFQKPILQKNKAKVMAIATTKEKEISLIFKLYYRSDTWHIYDIEIDGISLVYSFKAQFSPLLQKTSMDHLIEELKTRIKHATH